MASSDNLVKCSTFGSIKNCTITGVHLSMKNFTLTPIASNPNLIQSLEITKSTIPVITTELCTALPKIKSFFAIQQGIQIIKDYAFNNCTEITLISMPFNSIHTLGTGIFDKTKKLQEINIHGGALEQIDVNLLNNLGELTELVISANRLRELPVAAVKNLKKLKILYLYSNELTDLDAESLVKQLPSLKGVYINDNNLQCDRLNDIIATFKAKNILIVEHTHAIYLKKRDYIPHKIQDIICLTHVELESEKMKRGLNLSLAELKDTPIGDAVIRLKDIVSSGFADADGNIVTLFNMLNGTTNDLNRRLIVLNQTLNESSKKMHEMADTINQTLNETTKKMHEMADTIISMSNDYKKMLTTLSDNPTRSKNNEIVWIVLEAKEPTRGTSTKDMR
ncbi:Reticulon-4 receptor-like 2, partial [Pseudolycoriella hygida]